LAILVIVPVARRSWFSRSYFHEDFSAPDKDVLLNRGWRLLDPDADLWTRPDSSGCLTLFTHRADNWSPKELHYPIHNVVARPFTRTSFIATACLVGFRPQHNYQQAGLLLQGDADNYVRLDYAFADGRFIAQAVFEFRGETQQFQIPVHASDRVWLQIERQGDEFTARVRLDEEQRVYQQVARQSLQLPQDYVALAAFHAISVDLPDGNKMPLLWEPLPAHFDELVVAPRR
jgi:regulation of enolase protein 1 (concanavalin A-like superfamily)